VTLGEQQRLFARLVGSLIMRIYDQGDECTLDWAYRPPEVAAYYASIGRGIRSSLHASHLAIDLNLFKVGIYQTDSEAHRPYGEWWEQQHPLCRWGGRFLGEGGKPKPDGNHYSMEFQGRK